MGVQKFIHIVDEELSGDAQYKSFSDIPSYALPRGTTVRFMPGVYEIGSINVDGIAFEGVGWVDDVTLANIVLGNTSANTISFHRVTLSGINSVAGTGTKSIGTAADTVATLKFKDCKFTQGDYGIDNQGRATLDISFCDFSGVDKAVRSNAAVTARFTLLNASSNAAFTPANGATRAFTVQATGGAGNASNTGLSTRTAITSLS